MRNIKEEVIKEVIADMPDEAIAKKDVEETIELTIKKAAEEMVIDIMNIDTNLISKYIWLKELKKKWGVTFP